jgi:hypothetical protein
MIPIGSHVVPLEGKFLLIALVIVRITLNVIGQLVVKLSNTSTTKCGNKIVEEFEILTSF